jgi:hypothetical protein
MKLDHYEIKDALQREDWATVVSVLAAHFGLCLPECYRFALLRDIAFEREIEITQGERVYSWQETRGFDSCAILPKGADLVVNIYAPLADPAGPKAGAARS